MQGVAELGSGTKTASDQDHFRSGCVGYWEVRGMGRQTWEKVMFDCIIGEGVWSR